MNHPHEAVRRHRPAGEELSLWFPLGLALFGIVGSIATARLIVPPDWRTAIFMPWVVERVDQYKAGGSEASSRNMARGQPGSVPEKNGTKEARPVGRQKSVMSTGVENDSGISMPSPDSVGKKNTHPPGEEPMVDAATKPHAARPYTDSPQQPDCPPLFSVTFKQGSTKPMAVDLKAKVTRLQEWLSGHPGVTVFIEGHTNSFGPDEFNLLLSYRRSKAVAALLKKAGASSNQLAIQAFGEQVPLAGQPSDSARNRRASMRVDGAQECLKTMSNGGINGW